MSERVEARVSHALRTTAEQFYEAWLSPEKIRQWLAQALQDGGLKGDIRRVEVEAKVGGGFFFSDQRGEMEACHWGTYLELQEPEIIAYTWIVDKSQEDDPSKVRIEIKPDGDGCQVTLTHQMDAAWKDYIERTEAGWSRMILAVERLVAGE